MKKIFCVLAALLMFTVMFPGIARSQTGFLLGMGAGYLLSIGNNAAGGGSGAILYTASEELLKRIKEPLAAKQSSYWLVASGQYDENGFSLYQIFQKALPRGFTAESYEILQIVRVFHGDRVYDAAIWFVYIEKSRIAPAVKK